MHKKINMIHGFQVYETILKSVRKIRIQVAKLKHRCRGGVLAAVSQAEPEECLRTRSRVDWLVDLKRAIK